MRALYYDFRNGFSRRCRRLFRRLSSHSSKLAVAAQPVAALVVGLAA